MLNDTVRVYLTMIKRLMNYKESKTPDGISSGCVVMKKYACLLHLYTSHLSWFAPLIQIPSHAAELARYKRGGNTHMQILFFSRGEQEVVY